MSAFIAQSSTNLRPDYQQLSAYLLFDQNNIQRAIANGTPLDQIITSGIDPTAPFTPNTLDLWVNGLWFASLTLSLATALFAVLADEWYCHYLSPVAGDPQVRSRTRQLRYTGLIEWRVSTLINLLPLLLHLSLGLFFVGLVLSLLALQQGIALVIGILFLATLMAYFVTNTLPLIFPECPYKTPLSSLGYAIIMWIIRQSFTVQSAISSRTSKFPARSKTLEDFEIHSAERSRAKHDLDALRWLYVRSSTSAIRHLVIHALAGLPLEYIDEAEEVFGSHWDEIRNEKERMLVDCMALAPDEDGSKRWIPQDGSDIDRRIEPLLRLGRLFPWQLGRRDSSGIFGEHKLNFTMESISDPLLITLSTYKDSDHIQVHSRPHSMDEFAITALNDNRLHHPAVWSDLYNKTYCSGLLYDDTAYSLDGSLDRDAFFDSKFTSQMYCKFLTAIYASERNRSISPTCTLADAAVQVDKRNIITVLLSLLTEDPLKKSDSDERTLLLAIMRFSLRNTDDAQSTVHARQPHFALDDDFTQQLLSIAVPALNRIVNPLTKPLPEFDAEVFQEIGAYIASDSFPSGESQSQEDWWAYESSINALHCLASLMHRDPCFHVLGSPGNWATTSLFSNIAKLFRFSEHDEGIWWYRSHLEFCPCHQGHIKLSPRRYSSNINCLFIYILGQGFSRGIEDAYKAFKDKRSWGYIENHAYDHPKAIDVVTSYITGLSEATKKEENENPDATFPRSYIDDLHQAEAIRSICATIVSSGVPPHPILDSLASIAPNHQQWSNILEELNSDGDGSIEGYKFPENVWRVDKERLKTGMKHACDILEKCLDAKRDRKRRINWVGILFKYFHLPSTKYFHIAVVSFEPSGTRY